MALNYAADPTITAAEMAAKLGIGQPSLYARLALGADKAGHIPVRRLGRGVYSRGDFERWMDGENQAAGVDSEALAGVLVEAIGKLLEGYEVTISLRRKDNLRKFSR